jgi:hypothetical protein
LLQLKDTKSLILSEIQSPMLYVVNKERVREAFVAPLIGARLSQVSVLMPEMKGF